MNGASNDNWGSLGIVLASSNERDLWPIEIWIELDLNNTKREMEENNAEYDL
jgi:hypothetical protein